MTIYYRDELGIVMEEVDENGIDFTGTEIYFNDKKIDITAIVRIEK